MEKKVPRSGNRTPTSPIRRLEMPDLFGGAEKKTRPASVTILAEPAHIYGFLHDFRNFPLFLRYVTKVESLGRGSYRWTAELSPGELTQWDTETLQERKNELIAWRTKTGAPMQQTGAFLVEPAVAGRGTIVSLKLVNDSAFGKIMGTFEKFSLTDPDSEALRQLQRLKAYLETGEVPTVAGQPSGRDEDEKRERVA